MLDLDLRTLAEAENASMGFFLNVVLLFLSLGRPTTR
jgi:hypothetical protein